MLKSEVCTKLAQHGLILTPTKTHEQISLKGDTIMKVHELITLLALSTIVNIDGVKIPVDVLLKDEKPKLNYTIDLIRAIGDNTIYIHTKEGLNND